MAAASPDTVQLLSGLVAHMRQIVGDGACYAMLHYGALEEGKRFGSGIAAKDLARILQRFDEVMHQKTEILHDDGARLTLRVSASPFFGHQSRPMHGVILGLVEGALTASRAGRFTGTVHAGPDELRLELARDPS